MSGDDPGALNGRLKVNGADPYRLDNSTSEDNVYISNSSNNSSGQITISPYGTGTSGDTTWSWGGVQVANSSGSYAVFMLPERKIPKKVFVNGRLVTVGALGTDAECAYAGKKLIFEPGLINVLAFNGRLTVSLEYKNKTYHYNIGSNGIPDLKPNTTTLDAQLVSVIDHK